MRGKTEEWSCEEIRTVILYLDAVGFRDEEICRRIWGVCGFNAVTREQVYHILAADKQAKVPTAGWEDPRGVLPTEDDIEISDLLELYNESIFNYPVQSSKYQWNQWNLSRKELCSEEYHSRSQHHPLHVAKTAKVQNSKELGDKVLHEKLQDIFNNFSPQNFTVAVSEIKNLGVITEGSLNEVIDIVFEKAVENPNFSIPYANFCMRLSLLKVPCSSQENQLVDIGELLLAKCQKQLEKKEVSELCREEINRPVEDEKKQLQKILEEKQKSRRQLGTARFIAWLFKLDILTESAVHQVIENLLLRDDEVGAKCVCLLITAIGSDLNSDKIENYISDLKKIIDKQCASAKIENILQCISDLKMNNWVLCGEKESAELIDDILSEDLEEMQNHKNLSLQVEYGDSVPDDDEQQEGNSATLIPERKRQYDREFLLNLQFHRMCKQKPSNLPNLVMIKNKEAQQSAAPVATTVIGCTGSLLPVSMQESDLPDSENEKVQKNDKSTISYQFQDSPVLSGKETEGKGRKESPAEKASKIQITLNYNCKEDQWNPLNPEGKKQYDREFLLNLQFQPMSMKKPSDLPNLDVIKGKATLHKLKEMNNRVASAARYPLRASYNDTFERAFAWTNAPGRGPMHTGGVKARRHVGHENKLPHSKVIGLHTPTNQKVKLRTAENEWASSRKVESDTEDAQTENLYENVREILNKLTQQKFATLVSKFKQLDITTEESLNGVVDLIFEKAIDECNRSVLFAKMCRHLAMMKVATGTEGTFVNFRKLLLTKCQREFEKDRTDGQKREERIRLFLECETDEKRRQLQKDFEEEEHKNRKRHLGNIRFIGELFKLGMFTEPIMHQCIKKLLNQGNEVSLECLCCLLTTIGKELENEKKNAALMETYFTDMKKIIDKHQTSSRVRFRLQDVIDLRLNNWMPQHGNDNLDDHDQRKNRPLMSEGGSNTSGKGSKGNYSVDPMKLKLIKPYKADSIQLGPGGKFLIWAKGNSGGTKSSSIEQDLRPAASQNNRYAASSCDSSRGHNNQLLPPETWKTSSVSRECDNVTEAVKTLARTEPPESRRPQEASNVNGEYVMGLKGAELSVEYIEKKTKPLIDEFLHNSDLEEAVKCVVELASPSTVCVFITSAVNQVLERSSQSRHILGKLLHTLLKRKVITMEQYNKGLKNVLEFVDEYALDIPLIWDYLGELIEPILDDDYVSLAFLKDTLQPCIPSQTAGKLVSAVLLCASKKRGTLRVGEMWKESKLSWTDFLEPGANAEDFVKSHKLEFTTKQNAEPKLRKQITPDEVKQSLQRLLRDHESNEEIFKWLERHVEGEMSPPMYRALVTAIYESVITGSGANCELNVSKLKERMCILARYMDVNRNLELHAIFALQYLMNKLDHPKGILLQIFDLAYNEDFLSDDAFKQWEHCDDPAEQEGKGVAIHSVSSFFTWLKEGEDEDDESAEGD